MSGDAEAISVWNDLIPSVPNLLINNDEFLNQRYSMQFGCFISHHQSETWLHIVWLDYSTRSCTPCEDVSGNTMSQPKNQVVGVSDWMCAHNNSKVCHSRGCLGGLGCTCNQ